LDFFGELLILEDLLFSNESGEDGKNFEEYKFSEI
jgi:hypothetical protein